MSFDKLPSQVIPWINPIIDIKKNKFKKDNSSVFVFAITDKFKEDFASIKAEA